MVEGPRGQRAEWLTGAKVPDGDRAIWDDSNLALVQGLAVTYDGLNSMNLAGMEVWAMRLELMDEARHDNPSLPCYEEGALHMEKRKAAEKRTLSARPTKGRGLGKGGETAAGDG